MRILEHLSIYEPGPRPDDGLERTLLDVDDDGTIQREIGLDRAGTLLYFAPALCGEALWQQGAARFGVREDRTVR